MKRLISVLLAVLTVSSFNLLSANNAEAATTIFVRIEGVRGDSTDDRHKDWVEASSYSQGVTAIGATRLASGGTIQRPEFSDITITKFLDSSSPILTQLCAKGAHVRGVVIDFVNPGMDKSLLQRITLDDVVVSSVQMGGGAGQPPTETVAFKFARIRQEYFPPPRRDGSKQPPIVAGWDLTTNKVF
jgi:type VI secretion system secreted protein Hcp